LPSLHIVPHAGSVEEAGVSVELDMLGFDVDKALALLRESNPTLLDWF
jgi:predicted nucleotidyltransferase